MNFNKLFEDINDDIIDINGEKSTNNEEIEYNGYTIKHFPVTWHLNDNNFDVDGYVILSKSYIKANDKKVYLPLYCEDVNGEVVNFNTLAEAKDYIDRWLATNKVEFVVKYRDEIHCVIKDEFKESENIYKLYFHADNSLKGSFYGDEVVEWFAKDASDITTFDHIPTQKEIDHFFNKLMKLIENEFNKFNYEETNKNNGVNAEEIGTEILYYFTNIKLYVVDIENWDEDLIQQYDDVDKSFVVTNEFDDSLTWEKLA